MCIGFIQAFLKYLSVPTDCFTTLSKDSSEIRYFDSIACPDAAPSKEFTASMPYFPHTVEVLSNLIRPNVLIASKNNKMKAVCGSLLRSFPFFSLFFLSFFLLFWHDKEGTCYFLCKQIYLIFLFLFHSSGLS